MLVLIGVILILMWMGGLAFNVAGAFIHVLLILAIVVFAAKVLGLSL